MKPRNHREKKLSHQFHYLNADSTFFHGRSIASHSLIWFSSFVYFSKNSFDGRKNWGQKHKEKEWSTTEYDWKLSNEFLNQFRQVDCAVHHPSEAENEKQKKISTNKWKNRTDKRTMMKRFCWNHFVDCDLFAFSAVSHLMVSIFRCARKAQGCRVRFSHRFFFIAKFLFQSEAAVYLRKHTYFIQNKKLNWIETEWKKRKTDLFIFYLKHELSFVKALNVLWASDSDLVISRSRSLSVFIFVFVDWIASQLSPYPPSQRYFAK